MLKEIELGYTIEELIYIGICGYCECVIEEKSLNIKELKQSIYNFTDDISLYEITQDYSFKYYFNLDKVVKRIKLLNMYKRIDNVKKVEYILTAFKNTLNNETIDVNDFIEELINIVEENIK